MQIYNFLVYIYNQRIQPNLQRIQTKSTITPLKQSNLHLHLGSSVNNLQLKFDPNLQSTFKSASVTFMVLLQKSFMQFRLNKFDHVQLRLGVWEGLGLIKLAADERVQRSKIYFCTAQLEASVSEIKKRKCLLPSVTRKTVAENSTQNTLQTLTIYAYCASIGFKRSVPIISTT